MMPTTMHTTTTMNTTTMNTTTTMRAKGGGGDPGVKRRRHRRRLHHHHPSMMMMRATTHECRHDHRCAAGACRASSSSTCSSSFSSTHDATRTTRVMGRRGGVGVGGGRGRFRIRARAGGGATNALGRERRELTWTTMNATNGRGRWNEDGGGRNRDRMRTIVVKSLSSSSVDDDASSKAQLWWRALKLPMYSVAWVPLACGAALAYCQFGAVNAGQIAQLFLGSSLVIAWLNLTNDAFDSTTRVDESKPESVVRLLGGNARLVHAFAWSALAAGAALIGRACVASGSATSWRALVAAVTLGYAYQGPPFRLSYKGLGEPICFAAFGPLATVAFYLACAGRVAGPGVALTVPAVVSSVAVLVGCTTTFILFTSHFHQEDGDRAAGKLSPVVRLGLPGALLLADNLVGAHYAMIATLAAAGWLPYTAVFGLVVTYPLARHVVDYAQKQYDDGEVDKLFFTKYLAVRYHVVHGVLLASGVVAQRLFLNPSLFFP